MVAAVGLGEWLGMVKRGRRARPQAELGRGWHTKLAGGFSQLVIK